MKSNGNLLQKRRQIYALIMKVRKFCTQQYYSGSILICRQSTTTTYLPTGRLWCYWEPLIQEQIERGQRFPRSLDWWSSTRSLDSHQKSVSNRMGKRDMRATVVLLSFCIWSLFFVSYQVNVGLLWFTSFLCPTFHHVYLLRHHTMLGNCMLMRLEIKKVQRFAV